jgi:alpha/beta superfamily hydrolase
MEEKVKISPLLGIVLSLIALTGCDMLRTAGVSLNGGKGQEATPIVEAESVSLTTEDGIQLDANYYPSTGEVAVVFAHMGIDTQTSWRAFATEMAQAGMPALTFDFRCFGKSECSFNNTEPLNVKDVQAAIAYLRSLGYEKVVCVGASMGAMACMEATLHEELAGLGFIAGAKITWFSGLSYPADMINPAMPKLFIVADHDHYTQCVTDTYLYYDVSPQPKKYFTFPGMAHGTQLFVSPSGDQFHQVLMDFLLAIK